MPPARAASEGMAGDSSASAITSEYVRPSVVCPNMDTILYAMRLPRPVLMNPRARKKANAINLCRCVPGGCVLWLCWSRVSEWSRVAAG